MKLSQLLQQVMLATITFVIYFVAITLPASAASSFSAPNGASLHVTYFNSLETGITVYGTDINNLWCNNKYGSGSGSEWQSKCEAQEQVSASSLLTVETFGKKTSPNSDQCWDIIEQTVFPNPPDPIPGSRSYTISITSEDGNNAQMTIQGQSLAWQGSSDPDPNQLPSPLCSGVTPPPSRVTQGSSCLANKIDDSNGGNYIGQWQIANLPGKGQPLTKVCQRGEVEGYNVADFQDGDFCYVKWADNSSYLGSLFYNSEYKVYGCTSD